MARKSDTSSEAAHELWLPLETDPVNVERLVVSRYPQSQRERDAESRALGRHTRIFDPRRDPQGALVWSVTTRRERDEPPYPGLSDGDGLTEVFPGGLPIRAERRVIDLLLGLARRFHGGVVVDVDGAEGGRRLWVDPQGCIDLFVYSTNELDPGVLLATVLELEPSARLAMEVHEWRGPDPALASRPHRLVAALDVEDRTAIEEFSAAFDAHAVGDGDALDAYAVEVDLGAQGAIVVEAHAEDDPPPPIVAMGWREVIGYTVRWLPTDPEQAERADPDEDVRAARTEAHPRVRRLTRRLAELSDGEVLDSFGLGISRYEL